MRLPTCLALIVALTLGVACAAAAKQPTSARGADSAQDLRIREFLQKRFHIAEIKDIKLSVPTPSPFAGVFTRTLTVTTSHGPIKTMLFTDQSGQKVIIGEYLDMRSDPWGRINMEKLRLTDRATQGPADAPVTIVEFADFECPFCARAFGQIETLVNNRYKGKVRLIFKNFPLAMHPWARPAAIAAECIRRQNPADFWDFAQILYTSQAQINPANLRDRIDAYAKANKLDSAALNQCMMGKSADEVINQDQRDGMIAHVQSTPTFLIDGIPVIGLPEEKSFTFVLDSELKDRAASHASGH